VSPEQTAIPAPPRQLGYDLLRLIAIAGVVAIHSFGVFAAHPEAHDPVTWAIAAALSTGAVWVVPVFVMLSGALTLTPRAHRDGPGPFLRRRATRILPALVFWTFLYLVPVRMLLLHEHLSLRDLTTILVDGSAYPQLYFLYLIAGLAFVAPVIAPFLHAGGARRALVLGVAATALTLVVFAIPGILSLGGVSRPIVLGTLTYWLGYLGYYLLGYALSRIEFRTPAIVVAGVVFVLTWVLAMVQGREGAHLAVLDAIVRPDYLGVGVALMSAAVFVLGTRLLGRVHAGPRTTRIIVELSEASFGVFLVHLLILLIPYDLLPGWADATSLGQAVLGYVVTLLLSFGVVIVARRIPIVRLVV
jgi:surface polysaccharide O-acyltransferase-like enzyme